MGIMGSRRVSVLSLVVTIVTFWAAYAAQLLNKILVEHIAAQTGAAY
jgi:hypothetical protein